MPDFANWPTALDVEILLKSTAFWPAGDDNNAKVIYARAQTEIGARGARDAFINGAGWHPFLSETEDAETRLFMLPSNAMIGNGIIKLNAGLLRLDSVTVQGRPVDANGAIAHPTDAPYRNRPYEWLHLPLYSYFRMPSTYHHIRIEVSGRWGYCEEIPGDVWSQVQQYAALIALEQTENAQSVQSIGQAGFNKAWDIVGIISQKDLLTTWGKDFNSIIEKYKRRVVG